MLSILSFLIFFTYLGIMFIKYGIPQYISDGFYQAKQKWLFSIVMIITSALLVPSMFTLGNENLNFLVFFSAIGILFLSAEPHYKNQWEGTVHKVAAIFAVISSQLWCVLNHWCVSAVIWLIGILLLILAYSWTKQHSYPISKLNIGYWGEVLVFVNIYTTLLFLS